MSGDAGATEPMPGENLGCRGEVMQVIQQLYMSEPNCVNFGQNGQEDLPNSENLSLHNESLIGEVHLFIN
jgi:hypothetical protein